MSRLTRVATCALLDAIDEGTIDVKAAVEMCVSFMSEEDVEEMLRANDLSELLDGDDTEPEDEE